MIVCLSRASITKTGYVQKEIKVALDVADEQPEGTIFLIPLRLEECEVPQRLSRWHWVNLFEPGGYERLLRALTVRGRSALHHSAKDVPEHIPGLVSPESVLLRLKLRTALLYRAIVDCLRDGTSTGSAEIRNSTLRSIKPDLEDLMARGLLAHSLASQDLAIETTNRVDFEIINAPLLGAAIKRIERLSPGAGEGLGVGPDPELCHNPRKLRILVIGEDVPAELLRERLTKAPFVETVIRVGHEHHAWSAIREFRINAIFIGPLDRDLRSSEEFIFTVRREYPEIVFVLHLNWQMSSEEMDRLFSGTRSRLKHYFTLSKMTAASGESDELPQVLQKCLAWPNRT